MCLKIPPKYSVAFALGFMKGKSAVRIHRKAGLCSTVLGKQERTSIIISNTYEMGEFWRSAYEYQVDISVFRMRFGAFILSFFRMIR
jgi:hypothetical protein